MLLVPTQLLERVKRLVAGDHLALMVFGSAARGDEEALSDIDILQLTSGYRPSYRAGNLNVSVYTPNSLTKVAKNGGLFVLHLITEGIVLEDPKLALAKCLEQYSPPRSYEPLRQDLRRAIQLLNVSPGFYSAHWERCHSLALFILRSFLYAQVAEAGNPSFSIRRIAHSLGDPRISETYNIKYASGPTPGLWAKCVRLTLEYLGVEFLTEPDTAESIIANAYPESELTVSLGLRFLGGTGAVNYH